MLFACKLYSWIIRGIYFVSTLIYLLEYRLCFQIFLNLFDSFIKMFIGIISLKKKRW
jgi:hypothetical protein